RDQNCRPVVEPRPAGRDRATTLMFQKSTHPAPSRQFVPADREAHRAISRPTFLTALLATSALVLPGCSGGSEHGGAGADTCSVGITQLVEHPPLDGATAGFKAAFAEAGVEVELAEQNANGEQTTALTIAQQFAAADLDLALAVATPAAQAMAQN